LRQNIPNGNKKDEMAIKYANIFHCKTLQNLTKNMIFGLKICHLATLYYLELTDRIVTSAFAEFVEMSKQPGQDLRVVHSNVNTRKVLIAAVRSHAAGQSADQSVLRRPGMVKKMVWLETRKSLRFSQTQITTFIGCLPCTYGVSNPYFG
jgi:DNA-binding transcriptional regulator YbjK